MQFVIIFMIYHRFDSYANYCELFSYLLTAEEPVKIELPNKWLWDIIEEFVYQFQNFQQFKSKVSHYKPIFECYSYEVRCTELRVSIKPSDEI